MADAKALGIRLVTAKELQSDWPAVPALHLVYHDFDGAPRRDTYRVRLLAEPELAFGAKPEKPQRYMQPSDTPPAVYLPTTVGWRAVIADPAFGILITEGELKAAAAVNAGHTCLGLGGVSSWRTAKLGWGLLPELEQFAWHQRDVVICFDSDAATNPNVAAATTALCKELRARGASCRVANLPPVDGLEKTGLDDFLVHRGAAELAEVLGAAQGDELTQRLWEMNERFAFVLDPGIVYDEVVDAKYAPEKFKSAVAAHRWAEERSVTPSGEAKMQRVQVAPAWVEWPTRREVHRITYEPGAERFLRASTVLNEWRGWGCPPVSGSVKPWQKLLDRLLGGETPEVRRWFEQACLYPLRFPGAKLFTAIGLWSDDHGVGKTTVPVTLSRIYGRNYQKITQTQLEADFNGWAACRQLVLIDDVDGHDSRSKAAVMKSLITQEDLWVNIKHLPEYSVPDVCNLMMTSNKANAYYVEPKDRRWFVHEVSSDRDPDFFRAYYEWIGDPKLVPTPTYPRRGSWAEGDPWAEGWADGPSALFYYALNEPGLFDGFDPTAPAPMTRSKAAMIDLVKGELDLWLTELARDPDAKLANGPAPVCRDLLTARELGQLFDQVKRGPNVTAQTIALFAHSHFFLAAEGAMVKSDEAGEGEQFFAVRNGERWRRARPDAVAKHVRSGRAAEQAQRGGKY